LLVRKRFMWFISNRFFALGIIIFLVLSVGIMILREKYAPGYIQKSFIYDVGKLNNEFEKHSGDWDYYLDYLSLSRFAFWFILSFIGFVFAYLNRSTGRERVFLDCAILVVGFFGVLSFAATKLLWYDMPAYPLLAMSAGYGLIKAMEERIDPYRLTRNGVLFLVIVFSIPYWMMFRKSQANIIPSGEKRLEAKELFLFKRSFGPSDLDGVKVYYYGWASSLTFYKYKFGEKNENLELTARADFKPNDRVLVSSDSLIKVVDSLYDYEILAEENHARLVRIK
jgi:4-amino-4-deoxy-L-arabinose transferase-like glycosyltransferase